MGLVSYHAHSALLAHRRMRRPKSKRHTPSHRYSTMPASRQGPHSAKHSSPRLIASPGEMWRLRAGTSSRSRLKSHSLSDWPSMPSTSSSTLSLPVRAVVSSPSKAIPSTLSTRSPTRSPESAAAEPGWTTIMRLFSSWPIPKRPSLRFMRIVKPLWPG